MPDEGPAPPLPLIVALRMAATDRTLWGTLTGLWLYESLWRGGTNRQMAELSVAAVGGYVGATLVFR